VQYQYGPSIESLPGKGPRLGFQVKRVPLRITAVQKRAEKEYSWLGSFRWRGSVPMWLKRLTLEGEIVRNPSVSLSPTLTRNEKVEHYIRIKTHKPIVLRFWVESGVSVLSG